MRKCNYDKYPSTRVEGEMIRGWEEIIQRLANEGEKGLLVVECYLHHLCLRPSAPSRAVEPSVVADDNGRVGGSTICTDYGLNSRLQYTSY